MECSSRFAARRLLLPLIAFLVGSVGVPRPAEAGLIDVFLVSSHSSPTAATTGEPFAVQTSNVLQLTLNGRLRATAAQSVDNFSFTADQALTYGSHTRTINTGEPGGTDADRVNSEIGFLDEVGLGNPADPSQSLYFDRASEVVFNPVTQGFTSLILAEVGSLHAFGLALCPDLACLTPRDIFWGVSPKLGLSLASTPDFTLNATESDVRALDQIFLFRFSEPVFDLVKVIEFGDRKTFPSRMQIDFLGVTLAPLDTTIAPAVAAPLPAGLPLLTSGLLILGWMRRRGAVSVRGARREALLVTRP